MEVAILVCLVCLVVGFLICMALLSEVAGSIDAVYDKINVILPQVKVVYDAERYKQIKADVDREHQDAKRRAEAFVALAENTELKAEIENLKSQLRSKEEDTAIAQ